MNPQHSSGLPGELQQVELTIEMDSPEKATLRVPHASNLVLRAVERYPVTRTNKNRYQHKRQLVFQGVEPGITVLTNILVETANATHNFPSLTIEVLPVKKIDPPKPVEKEQDNQEDPAAIPAEKRNRAVP